MHQQKPEEYMCEQVVLSFHTVHGVLNEKARPLTHKILKHDAVKMMQSIQPENLETQLWPQDWKRSVFISIPKKGNAKQYSNYHTTMLISHSSKVMLKILQIRLQQYVN